MRPVNTMPSPEERTYNGTASQVQKMNLQEENLPVHLRKTRNALEMLLYNLSMEELSRK